LNADSQVIFILGILPRCGTNFLSNLLVLHPDCAPPDPVWEDFLVTHADLLANYSDTVAHRWDEVWGVTPRTQKDLDIALGGGICRFLEERCAGTRVISKTPRVENLDLFFRFFPNAKLLVLVRDGRSVMESGIRTFGWRRESVLHLLADAARTINRFEKSSPSDKERYRILRYEDLWQDTEPRLRELFDFLELEMGTYDLEQALNLPVRGSSQLTSQQDSTVHWDPVERSGDFDPLSRFADWSDAQHYRYNQVAGEAMQALGYPCKKVNDPLGLFRLQGLFQDITWKLKLLAKPLYIRLFRS